MACLITAVVVSIPKGARLSVASQENLEGGRLRAKFAAQHQATDKRQNASSGIYTQRQSGVPNCHARGRQSAVGAKHSSKVEMITESFKFGRGSDLRRYLSLRYMTLIMTEKINQHRDNELTLYIRRSHGGRLVHLAKLNPGPPHGYKSTKKMSVAGSPDAMGTL